jgi:hypothetical protein
MAVDDEFVGKRSQVGRPASLERAQDCELRRGEAGLREVALLQARDAA